MDQIERLNAIKKYIFTNKKVRTLEIASKFNISEQTVRKDFNILEEKNYIRRVHGGAVSKSTFNERLNINIDVKKKLCERAASYVHYRNTIYIDGGTSYYHLIDFIPDDYNISIITPSLPIALRVMETSSHSVYLLGGKVDGTTLETTTTIDNSLIKDIYFDIIFLGVSGFSKDFAFTEDNIHTLNIKRKVCSQSLKKIMVATSDKQNKIAFKKSFDTSDIDVFITEQNINDEVKKYLDKKLNLVLI
ncbi:DeoR/GlpR family DNA-binding transcription regulator [Dolosigranulum pigrum]|uniref:Lactose phosphotransferase system repressor n=1 Tax=Dolosigranulum pigrum ATCC 51524 TaxID=883103 RepID=H3NDR5_9LACT|nr:DeoR/GlpR family DNA-binding transcription regulator [Dolosigranulum pigrum]EHR33642.1 hypothetical protein HMPREF9703_00696 [Dolosigranulum pigrum ATCC 51524]